ncbi:MAG: alpha-hydroxy-acid oxidizing protein [Thermoplasmata archaeon]|nr:alpha-hydroxy-acid oxidizing protein [Thermoplasmata archaeon]
MADPRVETFRSLSDLEALAGTKVRPEIWDYIQGGAGEERTLRGNRLAFDRHPLHPRLLAGVSTIDPTTTILGQRVSAPFFVCPMSYQAAVHPDGEAGTAKACESARVLGIFSTLTSHSIGQIAAAAPSGPKWFQLYLQPDPKVSERLIRDAERAGCRALVLTVDAPLLGSRDRQSRFGFALNTPLPLGNGPDVSTPARAATRSGDRFTLRPETGATWEIVGQLAGLTKLPIVVKGVLTPEDARRAVDQGARGILVSNHGGRQLDGVLPSLEALPAIVREVGAEAEVYLDGGVRRGTDILAALALGARAVGIGRPVLWALACEGGPGVGRLLELLRLDLVNALALSGRRNIGEIDTALLGEPPRTPANRRASRRPRSRARSSPSGGSRGHRYGSGRLRPSKRP